MAATSRDEPLTPAEWKIMHIAWKLGRGAARDVYQVAGAKHGMAVSTVKTHLRRLVDKGFLRATRVGNSFLYQPKKPLLRSLFSAADGLLEKTMQGTTGPLLAYMLRRSQMSPDELDELRALLDAYEPEAPGDGRQPTEGAK